jgi:hypothetical protein
MPVQPLASAREEEIRQALARLVSGGPEAVWLPQVQPLLELPAVRKRAESEKEDPAEALRAVLLEAIEELGQSQYRNLLEIVLGLAPGSANLSAGERRTLAGERFRGGRKPVTAGTIRQHHEVRALAELAQRLASEAPAGRPQAADWIEWHPAVREAWAQQWLNLWRISVSDYDSGEVLEVLRELMREYEVAAWSASEVFGVFDLLLEAWLPASGKPSQLERSLEEAFRERLVHCDTFRVDEVVSHWVWQTDQDREMRNPSRSILKEPPNKRQLERLRAGEEKLLERYVTKGVAARVVAEPGIGFLIAVGALRGQPLLSVAERDRVKDLILRTVADAGRDLSQVVLMRGSGFADYVLQGRIEPESFYRMKGELISSLDEALHVLGLRTHTFILSGAGPLARREGLLWRSSEDGQLSARDLLLEGESQTLEVRSSGFADLLPDDRVGATWAASQAAQGLLRTVTAMLNGNGGTIVVGACPLDRAMEDQRFAGKRMRKAPIVGEYVVIGIDEEMSRGQDRYLQKVNRMLRQFIEPDPWTGLHLSIERIDDRPVLIIAISGSADEWFYYVSDSKEPMFLVRNSAGASERLSGREADVYKRQTPRL